MRSGLPRWVRHQPVAGGSVSVLAVVAVVFSLPVGVSASIEIGLRNENSTRIRPGVLFESPSASSANTLFNNAFLFEWKTSK